MSYDLTPEMRAEMRRIVTEDPSPTILALLDAADERDRLAGNRREPRDLDWDRSVDSYRATGWDDEPGDYERMFFESGWRAAIRALDGTDD